MANYPSAVLDRDVRPAAALKVLTNQVRDQINLLEGQRNRLHSFHERLLSPQIEKATTAGHAMPERVYNDTIEGNLEQIVSQQASLIESLASIIDRLDSAA